MAAEPEVYIGAGPVCIGDSDYRCYMLNPFTQRLIHICPHLAVDSSKQVGCCQKLPGVALPVSKVHVQHAAVVSRVLTPEQCPYIPVTVTVSKTTTT